jgi:hypothetical protein
MFMTDLQYERIENLWNEDPESRCKASQAVVVRSRVQTMSLIQKLPSSLTQDLRDFCANLEAIEAALALEPNAFRKIRPLTAVHLPAIITSLEAFSDLSANSCDPERLSIIEKDIKVCLQAARQARHILDSKAVTSLEIEVETLRDAIDLRASSRENLPQEKKASSGIGNRLTKRAVQGARSLTSPISTQISAGQKTITDLGSNIITRIDAGAELTKGYIAGIVEDGLDRVSTPFTRRMDAIGAALKTASASGVTSGIALAIIFPPAVPVALGISLIDGIESYERALDASERDVAQQRTDRQNRRKAAQAAQISRLKGKSPVVRMETKYIHVAINTETEECQAIILAGRYAGESLEEIDSKNLARLTATAPDTETREILLAVQNRWNATTKSTAPKI